MTRGRNGAPPAGGYEGRALAGDFWPGITAGHDCWCTCTWAFPPAKGGAYQVKVRNTGCVTHGGPLAVVLARMARLAAGGVN